MGERGNIGFVQHGSVKVGNGWQEKIDSAVFLYTHWAGYRVEALAAQGIAAAEDRWGEDSYATRIALTALIGDVEGPLSWGVSTRPGENSYPLPLIDFVKQEVRIISARDGDTQDVKKILAAYRLAKPESFADFLARVRVVAED